MEKSGHWKGGRITKRTGYYCVRHEGKYIFEHRLIMQRIIGRKLKATEVVHHKNGIRKDNRPENLELLSKTSHAKLHSINRVGENIPWAKLTNSKIKQIRKLTDKGIPHIEIARRFKIHKVYVSKIKRRIAWSHL